MNGVCRCDRGGGETGGRGARERREMKYNNNKAKIRRSKMQSRTNKRSNKRSALRKSSRLSFALGKERHIKTIRLSSGGA